MTPKERAWGKTLYIDDAWRKFGYLAKHRPYFYYADDTHFPTDGFGFRIPAPFASVAERYAKTEGRRRIFFFGGSTTFGVYVPQSEAYPAQVEALTGQACFNFGLQTMDLHGNLFTFVDVLREGMIPDVAVFLDGVNEKIGFIEGCEGRRDYEVRYTQYEGFSDLIRNVSLKRRLLRMLRIDPEPKPRTDGDGRRFAVDQGRHYLATKRCIERIAAGYGIQTVFLLQPTVWDYWKGHSEPRYDYLKTMYATVLEADPSVLDISTSCALDPENFIDAIHPDGPGYRAIAEEVVQKGKL